MLHVPGQSDTGEVSTNRCGGVVADDRELPSGVLAGRLFAFFRLSAYSGARRGELLFLRWSNVDFEKGTIRIQGTAGMVAGKRLEGTPKSGRERTVSLDKRTLTVLREHQTRQEAEQKIAGDAWLGDDYVFTTGLGRPVPPDTVTNLIAVLIRQYNEPAIPGTRRTPRQELPRPAQPLPPARLHDLRHVHATLLLIAGVPVHVVAERLGHADPAITLRVYAHVSRQHADQAANTFAAAVDGDDQTGASESDSEATEYDPVSKSVSKPSVHDRTPRSETL
ncbi:site-specific integrase [Kribbella sp. NPDC026596]|uniref:tyrosine-type recombinase/integrase n=1 Tax=Kribbella sp. NPDC026596 TaxID=3155122 RepID=UPI0034030ED8